MAADGRFSLAEYYDEYPRVEQAFQAALDESLHPRGPGLLYDVVSSLGLAPRARVIDVGCGEGQHTIELARRFGFAVLGLDPVERHLQLCGEALAAAARVDPSLASDVRFVRGVAESLPAGDASLDLVWCREVLVHVPAVGQAFGEMRRVLREDGRVLVHQMYSTERLADEEAGWLLHAAGIRPESADPQRAEDSMAVAGLHIEDRIELGSEWGEWAEEQRGAGSRRLLHAARLLRAPDRYIAEFGQGAYKIMLGDCLWHVYRMIGKLSGRIYVLAKAR